METKTFSDLLRNCADYIDRKRSNPLVGVTFRVHISQIDIAQAVFAEVDWDFCWVVNKENGEEVKRQGNETIWEACRRMIGDKESKYLLVRYV